MFIRWYPINLIVWKHLVFIVWFFFFVRKIFIFLRMRYTRFTHTRNSHFILKFPSRVNKFLFCCSPHEKIRSKGMKRKFLPFHRIFQFGYFSWIQTHSQEGNSISVLETIRIRPQSMSESRNIDSTSSAVLKLHSNNKAQDSSSKQNYDDYSAQEQQQSPSS